MHIQALGGIWMWTGRSQTSGGSTVGCCSADRAQPKDAAKALPSTGITLPRSCDEGQQINAESRRVLPPAWHLATLIPHPEVRDNNACLPQEGSVRLLRQALPCPGMKGKVTPGLVPLSSMPYVAQHPPPLPRTQD